MEDEFSRVITEALMDKANGNKGVVLPTYEEAVAYKKIQNKTWIVRIIDYREGDVLRVEDEEGKHIGACIREGARPIVKGWLVS